MASHLEGTHLSRVQLHFLSLPRKHLAVDSGFDLPKWREVVGLDLGSLQLLGDFVDQDSDIVDLLRDALYRRIGIEDSHVVV